MLQELLEAAMTEALGAEKGERTPARLGHRSGYYGRTLITRVGKLELRVPQDRAGRFSTELFEREQRSEKALVAALAEMSVQNEEICGRTHFVRIFPNLERCLRSETHAGQCAVNVRINCSRRA